VKEFTIKKPGLQPGFCLIPNGIVYEGGNPIAVPVAICQGYKSVPNEMNVSSATNINCPAGQTI